MFLPSRSLLQMLCSVTYHASRSQKSPRTATPCTFYIEIHYAVKIIVYNCLFHAIIYIRDGDACCCQVWIEVKFLTVLFRAVFSLPFRLWPSEYSFSNNPCGYCNSKRYDHEFTTPYKSIAYVGEKIFWHT
jgi:hypothetical protein